MLLREESKAQATMNPAIKLIVYPLLKYLLRSLVSNIAVYLHQYGRQISEHFKVTSTNWFQSGNTRAACYLIGDRGIPRFQQSLRGGTKGKPAEVTTLCLRVLQHRYMPTE